MIRTYKYSQGTRVRVRRGPFPIDPATVGQVGLVVQTDDYHPRRFGVLLDDEVDPREFHEDELEPLNEPKPAARTGSAGPNVAS